MISCCNSEFKGFFIYTLSNSKLFCRRLEYGICPICGNEKFRDIKYYSNGIERIKELNGISATITYKRWLSLLNNTKQGSYINQSFYYGDFKKIKRHDNMGNPIYVQLRKNFNGQAEVLGEVITRYGKNKPNNQLSLCDS